MAITHNRIFFHFKRSILSNSYILKWIIENYVNSIKKVLLRREQNYILIIDYIQMLVKVLLATCYFTICKYASIKKNRPDLLFAI